MSNTPKSKANAIPKISVCIIVKNAESTLEECLESLVCFDEIILVDNESEDNTLQIAREFNIAYKNLKIFESAFIGFGALKNLALSKASNAWIFSIDADEVLDKEVLLELEGLEWRENLILAMPRKNLYRREWIKACGWYPDFVNRIFNKTHTRFNANSVHESLEIHKDTQIVRLQNGLLHYAYYDMETLIAKMQHYSTLWAKQNLHKKRSSMAKSIMHGGFKFMRDYCIKKGFLYGYKGFIISFCNGLGAFFKYAKLYEMQCVSAKNVSLIITTYNQKERLALVLDSVKQLEVLPSEVLVADDGSKEDTKELIESYARDFPCTLKHIWQEDEGFRLSAIRNKAVWAASGEYIIMIDGDMVLESHFIKDHLRFAKPKRFLQGSRVLLDSLQTDNVLRGGDCKVYAHFKSRRFWILSYLVCELFAIRKGFFKKSDFITGIRGCNMSFYRQDYLEIGGFNEKFIGWGREDSEFVARFLFNGGELRRLKFGGIAYHLYHLENSRAMLEVNHQIYLQTIREQKTQWH